MAIFVGLEVEMRMYLYVMQRRYDMVSFEQGERRPIN